MDARSYTTAVANRARGGGCECPEYYPNCEIQFMNLANIHSIRKSFHALRQLCSYSADQANWYSQLEGTRWLSHMSGLMKAAVTLVAAVERDGRSVLVHCSDGWDRTPQIVALAELLLDPYYRTIDGFRILIEREWLAFGHKFADRCGHSSGSDDQNERCPVFLQWLDCVHQLLMQFPCAFQFSQTYLVKLVQHTYSNIFGTFLCNTQRERSKVVYGKTFSVWEFLNSQCFRNHLCPAFSTNTFNRRVLWPQCNVRDLHLWSEVYLGSIEDDLMCEESPRFCPDTRESSPNYMTKTRSYGDLMNDGEMCVYQYRRSSDPSIKCDSKTAVLDQDLSPEQTILLPNNSFNGHRIHQEADHQNCFPTYLDDGDCNQDCIFKEDKHEDIAQCQTTVELEQKHFGEPPPAKADGDDDGDDVVDCNDANFFVENVIKSEIDEISCDVFLNGSTEKTVQNGDINHNDSVVNGENGAVEEAEEEEEVEVQGRMTSAEVVGTFLDMERSNETSTDTIVGNEIICSSQCNGDERSKYSSSTSTHLSRSPNSGWEHALQNFTLNKNIYTYQHPLGEDGMVILRSAVQERLNQIMEEHNRKVELLGKELHIARQNLIKQSRLRCSHAECEQQDDNNSAAESVCSASEGQASAGESLRSDISWVAVDEGSMADYQRTLWVPDYAVNKCTGCSTEFWLGRRRHHCRKCGKIFCADCSENSTPLPSEHLFNPVRVCTNCFSELQREIPNQCKHANNQATNGATTTATRIAASSN